MLSFSSIGGRSLAQRVYKAAAKNIAGDEWFCTNKEGKGIIMTTGKGSAPSPPDYLLMATGACLGSGVQSISAKKGKPCRSIEVHVEGQWAPEPDIRYDEIRCHVKADTDLSIKELEKIIEIVEKRSCPLTNTLSHSPVIKTSIEVVRN